MQPSAAAKELVAELLQAATANAVESKETGQASCCRPEIRLGKPSDISSAPFHLPENFSFEGPSGKLHVSELKGIRSK